jgi:hypothetical protein
MFLITEDGKMHGFVWQCPTCDFATLNDRKGFCPYDDSRLKEVLRKGD